MSLYILNNKLKSGFTMIELLVVMVIIGIVSSFAIPSYVNARRRAADREATAMLVLIRAAEEVHRFERGTYIACINQVCNNDPDEGVPGLGLDLATGNPWTYTVTRTVPPAPTFVAIATGGGTGDWCIAEDQQTATAGTGC